MLKLRFAREGVTIYGKAEFLNPSGSIKDRFARHVITAAEQQGTLVLGSIILECSSGNTGVALAMIGAERGYGVEIVISESASRERRDLMEHLGARVVTFPEHNYWAGVG